MALVLQCSQCGARYELDNDANAEHPQCECGGRLTEADSALNGEHDAGRRDRVNTPGNIELEDAVAWRCRQCLEDVPGSFELCWNCGADRSGAPPKELAADLDVVEQSDMGEQHQRSAQFGHMELNGQTSGEMKKASLFFFVIAGIIAIATVGMKALEVTYLLSAPGSFDWHSVGRIVYLAVVGLLTAVAAFILGLMFRSVGELPTTAERLGDALAPRAKIRRSGLGIITIAIFLLLHIPIHIAFIIALTSMWEREWGWLDYAWTSLEVASKFLTAATIFIAGLCVFVASSCGRIAIQDDVGLHPRLRKTSVWLLTIATLLLVVAWGDLTIKVGEWESSGAVIVWLDVLDSAALALNGLAILLAGRSALLLAQVESTTAKHAFNPRQRWSLVVGAIVIGAMVLFPPWIRAGTDSVRFSFISNPPPIDDNTSTPPDVDGTELAKEAIVDVPRLLVMCCAAATLTAIAVLLFQPGFTVGGDPSKYIVTIGLAAIVALLILPFQGDSMIYPNRPRSSVTLPLPGLLCVLVACVTTIVAACSHLSAPNGQQEEMRETDVQGG